MKRFYSYSKKLPLSTFLSLIFLLVGFISFVQTTHAQQVNEVRVGITNNKPMCYFDDTGKPMGIFVSVIEYAAAKEDWVLVYVKDSFSSLRAKLEKGEIDIILSTAVSAERKKLYAYNETDVFNNWAEVYISPKAEIHSLLDLKEKRVATLEKGIYSTGPEGIMTLDEKFNLHCEFIFVDDYKAGLKAVVEGRADAAVVNRLVGSVYERELGLQKSGIVFAPVEIRFALNKENSKTPLIIKALDRHLTTLIQDNKSIYHRTISEALGGASDIKIAPWWFWYSLAVAAGLILTLLTFTILLRWQVKKKTFALNDANITLSKNERKYRRLVESTMTVPWELDFKTQKFTYIGPQAEEIFGYPVESLVDFNTWAERLHPDDRERIVDYCSASADRGEDHDLTYQVIHANGSILWIHDVVSAVPGSDGPVLIGLMHDITNLKHAEEALRESEERFKNIFEHVSIGMCLTSMDGHFLMVNNAICKLLGYTRKELQSINFTEITHPEDKDISFNKVQSLVNNETESLSFEKRYIHKNGDVIWTIVGTFLVRDEVGEPKYFITHIKDITENKNLEGQLRQAQKMEAIGTLAGGIAHDFNNILSAIMGYTELAINDINDQKILRGDLDEVFKGANRAKELVKQILTFSHRSDQQLHPLRIQLVIKEVLKLLRSSIPTTIEIKQNIDQDCETVLADPTQIHQVIMNLCTNAYHAMREAGGILAVSLQAIHLGKEDVVRKIHLEPGPYLKLEISDTGVGMTKEVQGRIFEPYFSTKEKGEGTGLGLAVTHGIITSLHGNITVYSEPGKGTTFSIYLPTVGIQSELVPEKELTTQLPTGNEHILFVDDDEAIVKLNKKFLEKLGYKVTAFTSSVDTLNTFQENPEGFDLVITDMTMPQMTGADLAQRILAINPDIPVILCTGYSNLINEEKAKAIGIRDYVMKPFIKKDFTNTIRKVLDAS